MNSNIYSKSCSCISCTGEHKSLQTSVLKIIIEGSHNTFNIFRPAPTKRKKGRNHLLTLEQERENLQHDNGGTVIPSIGDSVIDKDKTIKNTKKLCGVSRGVNCAILVSPTKNEEQQYATLKLKNEYQLIIQKKKYFKERTKVVTNIIKSSKFIAFFKSKNNTSLKKIRRSNAFDENNSDDSCKLPIDQKQAADQSLPLEKDKNDVNKGKKNLINLSVFTKKVVIFFSKNNYKHLFRTTFNESTNQKIVELKKTTCTNALTIKGRASDFIDDSESGNRNEKLIKDLGVDKNVLYPSHLLNVSNKESLEHNNYANEGNKVDLIKADISIANATRSLIYQKIYKRRKSYSTGHLDIRSVRSQNSSWKNNYCKKYFNRNYANSWKCLYHTNVQTLRDVSLDDESKSKTKLYNDFSMINRECKLHYSTKNRTSNRPIHFSYKTNLNLIKKHNFNDTYNGDQNIDKSFLYLYTPILSSTLQTWSLSKNMAPFGKTYCAMRVDRVIADQHSEDDIKDEDLDPKELKLRQEIKRRQELLDEIRGVKVSEEIIKPGKRSKSGKAPKKRKKQGHKKSVRAISSYDFNIEFTKDKTNISRDSLARKRIRMGTSIVDQALDLKEYCGKFQQWLYDVRKDITDKYQTMFPPKRHRHVTTRRTTKDQSTQKKAPKWKKMSIQDRIKYFTRGDASSDGEIKLPKNPTFPSKADIVIKTKQVFSGNKHQAVKVGSSLSFGVEFHKNLIFGTDVIQTTAKHIKSSRVPMSPLSRSRGVGASRLYPDKKEDLFVQKCKAIKVKRKKQKKQKIKIFKPPVVPQDELVSQAVSTKTIERCFCSLKYNKEKIPLDAVRYIKHQEIMAKHRAGRVSSLLSRGIGKSKLLPYECPPGACELGICEPVVCNQQVQKTSNDENDAPFIVKLKKQKKRKPKKKKKESYIAKPLPPEILNLAPKDLESVARDLTLGSQFSFHVEFFKDEKKEQEPQTRLKLNVKPDKIKKEKYLIPVDDKEDIAIETKPLRPKSAHTGTTDSRDKSKMPPATSTSTIKSLKRCYCTLAFTHRGKKRTPKKPKAPKK